MKRTYNLERLYHQFMRPLGIPNDRLPFLVTRLYDAGFIEVFHTDSGERYSENEKLKNKKHTKELFKLIQRVKNENV